MTCLRPIAAGDFVRQQRVGSLWHRASSFTDKTVYIECGGELVRGICEVANLAVIDLCQVCSGARNTTLNSEGNSSCG